MKRKQPPVSNGKVIVILLILAAVLGAWLGPAGERVDPELGPMEAFFKYAIRFAGKPERVYLAVSGKSPTDPPAALMARFAGDIFPFSALRREGRWCSIELTRLEWKENKQAARCEGKLNAPRVFEILATEMHLTSRRQWSVDSAERYDTRSQRWVLLNPSAR